MFTLDALRTGVTFFALHTSLSPAGHSGVGLADKPVAVGSDVRRDAVTGCQGLADHSRRLVTDHHGVHLIAVYTAKAHLGSGGQQQRKHPTAILAIHRITGVVSIQQLITVSVGRVAAVRILSDRHLYCPRCFIHRRLKVVQLPLHLLPQTRGGLCGGVCLRVCAGAHRLGHSPKGWDRHLVDIRSVDADLHRQSRLGQHLPGNSHFRADIRHRHGLVTLAKYGGFDQAIPAIAKNKMRLGASQSHGQLFLISDHRPGGLYFDFYQILIPPSFAPAPCSVPHSAAR